jgi:hypothetical protein
MGCDTVYFGDGCRRFGGAYSIFRVVLESGGSEFLRNIDIHVDHNTKCQLLAMQLRTR